MGSGVEKDEEMDWGAVAMEESFGVEDEFGGWEGGKGEPGPMGAAMETETEDPKVEV